MPQSDARYYPKDGSKVYEMKYKLPPSFSCPHCVLQWRYISGNNWGTCPDGTGAVGCGPQEEFRACADVSIGKDRSTVPTIRPTTESPDVACCATTPVPPGTEETSYTPVTSLIIALVCFVSVFIILAALFIYYYKMGRQVKLWLLRKSGKSDTNSGGNSGAKDGANKPPLPPLPPPRTKKPRSVSESMQDNMQEISLA